MTIERPTIEELEARVWDALNLVMSNNALYVELADAALTDLAARAREAEKENERLRGFLLMPSRKAERSAP